MMRKETNLALVLISVIFFGSTSSADLYGVISAFKATYSQAKAVSEPTALLLNRTCQGNTCERSYLVTQTHSPSGEGVGVFIAALVTESESNKTLEIKSLKTDELLDTLLPRAIDRSIPGKKIPVPSRAGGSLMVELDRPIKAFKLVFDQTDATGEPQPIIISSSCGFFCENSFLVVQEFKSPEKIFRKMAYIRGNLDTMLVFTLKEDILNSLETIIDKSIPPKILPFSNHK